MWLVVVGLEVLVVMLWHSGQTLKEARVGNVEVRRVCRVSNIHANISQKLGAVKRTLTGQQADTSFAHDRAAVEGNTSVQTTQRPST
jgi:hypothetical protein